MLFWTKRLTLTCVVAFVTSRYLLLISLYSVFFRIVFNNLVETTVAPTLPFYLFFKLQNKPLNVLNALQSYLYLVFNSDPAPLMLHFNFTGEVEAISTVYLHPAVQIMTHHSLTETIQILHHLIYPSYTKKLLNFGCNF